MGTQQILLIALGLFLVSIAVAVGLNIIHAQSASSNRDAIVNDLNDIVANANQFKLRPTGFGGGGGVYDRSKGAVRDYDIPVVMKKNANASYSCIIASDKIIITGTSNHYTSGTVTVTVTADGSIASWTYGDDFQ